MYPLAILTGQVVLMLNIDEKGTGPVLLVVVSLVLEADFATPPKGAATGSFSPTLSTWLPDSKFYHKVFPILLRVWESGQFLTPAAFTLDRSKVSFT